MESDPFVQKDARKHVVKVFGHPYNLAETDETRPGPGGAVTINRTDSKVEGRE